MRTGGVGANHPTPKIPYSSVLNVTSDTWLFRNAFKIKWEMEGVNAKGKHSIGVKSQLIFTTVVAYSADAFGR